MRLSGTASHAGRVNFSYRKYYGFRKKVFSGFAERFYADLRVDFVTRALQYGDTQPAVVVSVDPLLVAAYSDEMDAVMMLRFPCFFAETYGLKVGSRLTTSNLYTNGVGVPDDIHIGKDYLHQYTEFFPVVQLFLGKNEENIRIKETLFDADTWRMVADKAISYREKYPDTFRDGFFYFRKGSTI